MNSKNVASWVTANKFTVNSSKCYALLNPPNSKYGDLSIILNNNKSKINIVPSLGYLGTHLDNKILFKQDIEFLQSKLSRFVGISSRTQSVFAPFYFTKNLL